MALPEQPGCTRSRAVPVDFHHCPSAKKPGKNGDRLPTPEQIRKSDKYSWVPVKAWAAGKEHVFNVKVIHDCLWRSAGQNHNLQVVVIKPLGYRFTKKSKILYREPAYLICTDKNLDLERLLQA
jgi:hypothetical protein